MKKKSLLITMIMLIMLLIPSTFNIVFADTTPVITSQPSDIIVNPAYTTTLFSLTATGDNLRYQWYYSDTSTGEGIAMTSSNYNSVTGINTNTLGASYPGVYKPTAIGGYFAGNRYFYCVVSNSAGSVTSNRVYLQVAEPPTIISQPSDVTAKVGDTATFSVGATPGIPKDIIYRWETGETSRNTGFYVYGGTIDSKITTDGTSLSLYLPDAYVTPGYTYKWQATLESTQSFTLSGFDPNCEDMSGYKYTGNDAAEYNINISPDIGTVIPANTPTTITITATVQADTKNPLMYHSIAFTTTAGQVINYSNTKLYSENGGRIWTEIPGGSNSTYTTTITEDMQDTYYRCRVITLGHNTSVASNIAKLSIAPNIVTQPTDRMVGPFHISQDIFTLKATGPNLNYQWYYSDSSTGEGTALTESTYPYATDLGTNLLGAAYPGVYKPGLYGGYFPGNRYFYCVVSNSSGSVTSNRVYLQVAESPTVTSHPSNVTAKGGETVTFNTSVTPWNSKGIDYQWQIGEEVFTPGVNDGTGNYTRVDNIITTNSIVLNDLNVTPGYTYKWQITLESAHSFKLSSIDYNCYDTSGYKYTGNDLTMSNMSISPATGTIIPANTPTTITVSAFVAADTKEPILCHIIYIEHSVSGQEIKYSNSKVFSDDGGMCWWDIAGATSSSYSTTVTKTSMDNTYYRCRVRTSGSGAGDATNAAKLTVQNYSDGTNKYPSLESAFTNAPSGTTITVLGSIEDIPLAIVEEGKTITLDLNGKTITAEGNTDGYFIANYGKLTITDTTSEKSGVIQSKENSKSFIYTLISNNGTGNLELNAGTIWHKGLTNNFWYTVVSHGTFTMNGGLVKQTGAQVGNYNGRSVYLYNGTFTMNGGVIESEAGFSLIAYATGNVTININNGSIYRSSSEGAITLGGNVSAVVNIDGGNINGIYIWSDTNSASININGGTIINPYGEAINNRFTNSQVNIGNSSDTVNIKSPILQGTRTGIYSVSPINFNNGIVKAKEIVFDSEVSIDDSYGIHYDTEVINSEIYKTAYLIPKLMARETQSDGGGAYDNFYMIGAERAGLTQYKSEQVKTITILDSSVVPSNATASWNVTVDDKIKGVIAWIIPAGTLDGMQMYDLYIGGNGGIMVPSGHRLFAWYTNCTEIKNANLLDTSENTDMHAMFYHCESLKTVDVSRFDTSKVVNMSSAFDCCYNLEALNVSNWNTNNVNDMKDMFWGCKTLTELDVSNFKIGNVTRIRGMFAFCENITELDVSNWDTSNVTDMCYVFQECVKLGNVDVSKWKTSNVTAGFEYMFYNCDAMTSIKVSNFDTSKAENMYSTFAECDKLTGIDLGTWNTQSVTTMQEMFKNSTALKSILLGPNFAVLNGESMFTGATALTAIITQRETPMTLAPNTGLELETMQNTILYVKNATVEDAYELAANYNTVFANSKDPAEDMYRIRPILEVAGSNPTVVFMGSTYDETVDKGALVGGFNKSNSSNYTQYGYYVTTTGLEVDTKTTGEKEVTYTLNYENPTTGSSEEIMTIKRKVEVIDENTVLVTEWLIPSNADETLASTGIANTTITIPIPQNASNKYIVVWGDGTTETYDGTSAFPTHTYTNTAETTYQIKIGGFVNIFGYDGVDVPSDSNTYSMYSSYTNYLTGLKSWGEIGATQYGFSYCTNLTGAIPEPMANSFANVTNFDYTFYNCSNLADTISTDIFNSATKATSYKSTFAGNTNLKTAEINLASIGEQMFYGCNNLTEITIGDNMKSIGTDAFEAISPYSSTNLLKTNLKSANEIAINFEWQVDNRLLAGRVKSAPIISAKINNFTGEEYQGTLINKSIAIELTNENAENVYKYEWSNNSEDGFTATNLITASDGVGKIILSKEMFGTVYFRAVDKLNNYSEISSIEVKIDKTSPTGSINIIPIHTGDESKYTNTNEVEIKVGGVDNYSETEKLSIALINESDYNNMHNDEEIEWISFSEQKTFTLTTGEGLRKVYVIIKDEAGNQSKYLAK